MLKYFVPCGVVSIPQRQRRQPPMFLNTVLIDLIFGNLGRALISGWVLIKLNKVYLGQVNPAVFLKILLHLLHMKLEPVVTLQFHSFQVHASLAV